MRLLTCLLIFFPFLLSAQKQGNIWYFGYQSGLSFNGGSVTVITGGATGTDAFGENQEGTSCISDSAGALLFYASGKSIWNRNHQYMANGMGLYGGISSTQASLIVPQPGNDSLFYVFTSDAFQHTVQNKGYRYSVVNMCLANGNGAVVSDQKNILLSDSCTEKLAACRDGAGTGYWILARINYSNRFKAWHLTSAGITATVTSALGTYYSWNPYTSSWLPNGSQLGQMKFNPMGTKVAVAMGGFAPAFIDIYDFNNTTGQLANDCHFLIDSAAYRKIYGIEFSADGSKLYATAMTSGSSPLSKLFQFDLTAGGGACQSIKNSITVIYQSNINFMFGGLQIGPDNKIYVSHSSWNNIGRIEFPNLGGLSCVFTPSAIYSPFINNNYTLPSFIAGYSYSNGLANCCHTLNVPVSGSSKICTGQSSTLIANCASSYTWSNGPVSSIYVVTPTVQTAYTVTGTAPNSCTNSTIYSVSVEPMPTVSINSPKSKICAGDTLKLIALGASTYTWNNGLNSPSISLTPTMSTTFSVIGANNSGCIDANAFSVIVLPKPTLQVVVSPSLVCQGDSALINVTGVNTFTLHGGILNALSFAPIMGSTYSLTGTDITTGCKNTTLINVTVSPLPNLGMQVSDSIICMGDKVFLNVWGANIYLWNNTVGSSVIVASPTLTSTFTVLGTNTLTGCSSILTKEVKVVDCNVVSDIKDLPSYIRVYPNPSSGEFTVEFFELPTNLDCKITDIYGRTLKEFSHDDYSKKIAFKQFEEGIYYLFISPQSGSKVILKIVIE